MIGEAMQWGQQRSSRRKKLMLTHCERRRSLDAIDSQVRHFLVLAYERSAVSC